MSNKPKQLIDFETNLTIDLAMNGLSLAKLERTITKKNVVSAITFLAIRVSDEFNFGQKFSPDQASQLALDIVDVYKYETLEDIVLMFKYARQGRIGDGKDFKLDSQTVFHKWFPQYLDKKAEALENSHRKKKSEANSLVSFTWNIEDVEKFTTSDKKTTVTTSGRGLGTRKREEYGVPESTPNIQMTRQGFLKALRETAMKADIASIRLALSNVEGDDAINVLNQVIDFKLNKK